jgi:choline-sulfatase
VGASHALLGVGLLAVACAKPATDPADAGPSAPVSAAASTRPPPPAPKVALERPYNVVLLIVDAMRADIQWAGYPRADAPFLTAFQAENCVTYTRGYSISSYTAQSVVPLLVSEYPSALPRDGYFFTKYWRVNLFLTERLQKAGHRTLGGQAHGYFQPMMKTNQGFDDWRMIPGPIEMEGLSAITGDKHLKLAKKMLADPRNTKLPDGKRFFAYFHFSDPHFTWVKHEGHPDFGNQERDRYDNEIHYVDSLFGDLITWARQQPWGAHTVFIITGDHGEGFGEHGRFRHAYDLWESLVKVPLLICVPGVPPRRVEQRRSHIDLAPTIADLMGVALDPPMRGVSLVPEVLGETIGPRRIVLDLPRNDVLDRRRAVIADGYKIIAFGDDATFQLYNLDRDPGENDDRVQKEPETFQRMRRIYEEESRKIPIVPVTGGARLVGAPPRQRW